MTEQVQTKEKFDFKKFFKKSLNTLKSFFSKSYNIILVVFLVILSIGVILPLIKMVADSLKVHTRDEAMFINELWGQEVKKGQFTFMQWPTLLLNNTIDVGHCIKVN